MVASLDTYDHETEVAASFCHTVSFEKYQLDLPRHIPWFVASSTLSAWPSNLMFPYLLYYCAFYGPINHTYCKSDEYKIFIPSHVNNV